MAHRLVPPMLAHQAICAKAPLRRLWRRLFAQFTPCAAAARERRALAELDARLLRDVGLTDAAARREAAKGWRAPPARR